MFIKMVPMILLMSMTMVEILTKKNFFSLSWKASDYNNVLTQVEFNWSSSMFIIMVTTVSMFIMVYSSFYMESYNKKKFIVLSMLFFSSMVFLSMSDGIYTTMMGWDGLGISSICLIMMYQNSKTLSNSLMTMTFNRLGDVFMVVGLVSMSNLLCDFSSTLSTEVSKFSIILFILASMTKSAQFPMSTWLPAAMSAPTPISAMVHSSTLVTAGVYLCLKVYKLMDYMEMLWIVLVISSVSMISAGVFSMYENDLKKVIAFSTMSNISLMILMIAMKFKGIAMAHMITHALFKTSVFMSAGMKFMTKWGDQNISNMVVNKKTQEYLFKVSSVMMTAIPFSSSFYTKDLFMEMNMYDAKESIMGNGLMWTAAMLTILYSKLIMISGMEKFTNKTSLIMKKGNSIMSLMMCSMMPVSSKILNMTLMINLTPMISPIECSITLIIVILSSLMQLPKYKFMMTLSTSMLFKTEFSIKKPKILIMIFNFYNITDFILMNKTLWSMKSNNYSKYSMKNAKPLIMMIMTTFMLMMMT